MKRRLGMNGVYSGDVSTDSDGYWLYWLAHQMIICGGVQQWILTTKTKS